MIDRLMPWHYPPDYPGFWETKKMPKKEYVVKLSVLVKVYADNGDDADERATELLRGVIAGCDITDVESEEVTEV